MPGKGARVSMIGLEQLGATLSSTEENRTLEFSQGSASVEEGTMAVG